MTSSDEPSPGDLPLPLEQVLAAVRDAVLVTEAAPLDEPGPRIVYVNAAFTTMTGWAAAEVLGRSPRMLQADGMDQAELGRLRQALDAGEVVRVELRNRRKDGRDFFVELEVSPVHDGAGRLTHFVAVQRETTDRRREQDGLSGRLLRDEHTGLMNRVGLERALAHALAAAADGKEPPTLLLCDVHGLGRINSSLGRACGDVVVQEVARRLTVLAAGQALVARLESGEFALLLPGTRLTGLVSTAERLRRTMLAPVVLPERELVIAVGSGLATASAGSSPESLLREADLALRAAKVQGLGRYEFYDAAMGLAVERRLDIEQDLRTALQHGELLLHHQPIVELSDGRPDHAEALLRWFRNGRVHLGPAEFIPVAEDSGLIVSLGGWTLHQACLEALEWQERAPGLGVAVNLSPRQLADAALLSDVDRALAGGLDPALLTLEVTEGAFLADPEAAAATLHRLRRRGVRLSLDDFGTGYSSLAYLTRLPVDSVKIDKTFVDGVEADVGSRAVVTAVLALAGDLGLDVVAEGIETHGQREALLALGCRLGQGYLFARPAPADQLTT